MRPTRPLIALALPLLLAAASDKPGDKAAAGDFAEGAISYLVSKRCEASPKLDTRTIEWPALVYGPGHPPLWGRKAAGACRGLDTWVLSESVGAGTTWAQGDHAAIEKDPNITLFDDAKGHAAFKQTFGWELPERGDYIPPAHMFLRYDAKKVTALFDRLYPKPADRIGGATAQEIYDVLFKDFVTRFAREVALIKTTLPKAQLSKQAKAYQVAAKQAGGKFQGPEYLKQVAATILPKDQEQPVRAGRTLGVILRRVADGTWPTVNRLLAKIVRDYDPSLSQELAKTL